MNQSGVGRSCGAWDAWKLAACRSEVVTFIRNGMIVMLFFPLLSPLPSQVHDVSGCEVGHAPTMPSPGLPRHFSLTRLTFMKRLASF